jgi:N-acetylmuramoyl-L-alanine amidase
MIAVSVSADISIRHVPSGKVSAARSFELDGMVYVSLADFAREAGFKQSQGVFSRKHTFTSGLGKVVFVEGNPFYMIDTVSAVLPFPPVRRDGSLFLPAPYVVAAFGGKHGGLLSFDAVSSAITVNALKYNVLSITSDVKQNGTVVSIVLADSLPFESAYFHPNVVISFGGGKLDPGALARKLRGGLIDSAFVKQHDGSAQVSVILNKNIEKPHIDYNRAARTLMVSLKPKVEQKKPPSRSVAVDHSSLIRTIVVDPGHGGKDPGAIGPTGVQEKDVVLAISLELRKMLEKAGLTVYMTREKDVFVPLIDRTKFANEKKADLFVSVHANAIPGDKKKRDTVRGYKIYFLSQAKNEEDKLAAMRENAVIELEDKATRQNYDALQNVLISIAGDEYLRESQELSIIMEQTFGSSQKNIPRSQLGVGQANFWVLNGAYMPAVLVEVGFISNSSEEKLLSDKRVQYQQAAALSEAIIKFKQMFETGQ